jgi:hypothetical protein
MAAIFGGLDVRQAMGETGEAPEKVFGGVANELGAAGGLEAVAGAASPGMLQVQRGGVQRQHGR